MAAALASFSSKFDGFAKDQSEKLDTVLTRIGTQSDRLKDMEFELKEANSRMKRVEAVSDELAPCMTAVEAGMTADENKVRNMQLAELKANRALDNELLSYLA